MLKVSYKRCSKPTFAYNRFANEMIYHCFKMYNNNITLDRSEDEHNKRSARHLVSVFFSILITHTPKFNT